MTVLLLSQCMLCNYVWLQCLRFQSKFVIFDMPYMLKALESLVATAYLGQLS